MRSTNSPRRESRQRSSTTSRPPSLGRRKVQSNRSRARSARKGSKSSRRILDGSSKASIRISASAPAACTRSAAARAAATDRSVIEAQSVTERAVSGGGASSPAASSRRRPSAPQPFSWSRPTLDERDHRGAQRAAHHRQLSEDTQRPIVDRLCKRERAEIVVLRERFERSGKVVCGESVHRPRIPILRRRVDEPKRRVDRCDCRRYDVESAKRVQSDRKRSLSEPIPAPWPR